ncbi:MAG TPA: S-methyl-5-thioribose-1-phosphate isomerase [Bacteroidota bacterium]
MTSSHEHIQPLELIDRRVRFLDQTLLPAQEIYVETDDEHVIADALRRLAIRGAPLIGIAAAYGVVLAINRLTVDANRSAQFENACTLLSSTRPTAVNLVWSLQRLRKVFERYRTSSLEDLQQSLRAEALAIHWEDAEMCRAIGEHGAALLPAPASVLTHCNTGRLATGGKGTALGIIETAWELRRISHVYIDETRPLLQGARLTAWELGKLEIPATLVVDSAAGFLMQQGLVNAVVVGADRIAANGDVANKVGTYSLATLAQHHRIPLYVAAPTSTIDFETASGGLIPIEQRAQSEVVSFFDNTVEGIDVYNPAFDVTPHEMIAAIITEAGVIERPTIESMAALRSKISKHAGGKPVGALS